MELVINVSALDKTNSAVVSAADRTEVDSIEMLTIGNVEPFTVSFCNALGTTPAWVTDAGTVVSVAAGRPSVDGALSYASASLAVTGSTRTGSLDLDTAALRNAADSWPCCRYCGRNGFWLVLEIRYVTTVALSITAAESVALLPVFVCLPVLAYA